jgi:hypothetical protein
VIGPAGWYVAPDTQVFDGEALSVMLTGRSILSSEYVYVMVGFGTILPDLLTK